MPNSFKVVVERYPDHWSAWFDGYPQIARCGECHDDAIQQLLELFGEEIFDVRNIAVVDESISEGHLEIMVPLRRARVLPSPSAN